MIKSPRREFLKKGLAGICGAAVVPGILNARSAPTASASPSAAGGAIPSLPSRPLGRTGLATPLISMGTAEAPTVEFIRQGYDAGIKFFFSATYYGHGNNERLVGQALKDLRGSPSSARRTADGTDPGAAPCRGLKAEVCQGGRGQPERFASHIDMLFLPFAEKRESHLRPRPRGHDGSQEAGQDPLRWDRRAADATSRSKPPTPLTTRDDLLQLQDREQGRDVRALAYAARPGRIWPLRRRPAALGQGPDPAVQQAPP
jgi:hypothetical protein